MPRIDWRLAVKGLAGFAAGLAMWVFLSPLYERGLDATAEKLMRAFERPPVTELTRAEDGYTTVDRTDFDRRSTKRPAMPVKDLTFNIALMTALFAASRRTFSDRNMGGFVIASVLLFVTHVLGVVTEVMSIYVAKLGMWSTVHYSDLSRNFWGVANHFYRLVLMYAIAFALWWIFRGRDDAAVAAGAKKKKRR